MFDTPPVADVENLDWLEDRYHIADQETIAEYIHQKQGIDPGFIHKDEYTDPDELE